MCSILVTACTELRYIQYVVLRLTLVAQLYEHSPYTFPRAIRAVARPCARRVWPPPAQQHYNVTHSAWFESSRERTWRTRWPMPSPMPCGSPCLSGRMLMRRGVVNMNVGTRRPHLGRLLAVPTKAQHIVPRRQFSRHHDADQQWSRPWHPPNTCPERHWGDTWLPLTGSHPVSPLQSGGKAMHLAPLAGESHPVHPAGCPEECESK